MVDTNAKFDDPTGAERTDEFDSVRGIIADGVVGAAGGLVGITMMTVVLVIGESFGAFNRDSFALLTQMLGLETVVPPVTFGFVVFLLVGMFPWPLLFASLKGYLPGKTDPVHGIFFGTALWTGYVFAFYDGYAGLSFLLYLVVTLIAHWMYGIGVGLVFDYLSSRPDTLV
ncbi:DUF6789 family protein [Haloarculaceae archaeon H-GB2-1]|nr:hypothetical protein [Haloarculaceae archaeon H-GB1-1]MEA5406408.1 DUF6789 family protein [Haloarculaceae archaeon H-GB2-1]